MRINSFSRSFILMAFLALFSVSAMAGSRDYYQIQVFRLTGKAQEAKLDNYLKNAYLPAIHRAGIPKVGVFKPVESDTTSGKRVYVWMSFKSLDQFSKIQDVLLKDKDFQAKGIDFLGAPVDQKPFVRKESILLKAFPDAPNFFIPTYSTSPSERIYELRSYEGPTDNLFRQKAKMFNEGGEIKLFNSLGFNTVFNAEVISGSTMPNLMYMTSFSDMASHDAHWKTFGSHPDWKKLSSMDEYKNTVSKAVILLLHPTDYSDF
ncbi:MAG TPA: NIPSNAP family containing protein [Prolixibacteraceae bacterium]|nr:NIPSNAP family containing protein [Prolixibacteraceae bacterium]